MSVATGKRRLVAGRSMRIERYRVELLKQAYAEEFEAAKLDRGSRSRFGADRFREGRASGLRSAMLFLGLITDEQARADMEAAFAIKPTDAVEGGALP